MYRSGPRIACGTCAPRVGALGIATPLRFDLNAAIKTAAEASLDLDPAWWQRFWMALTLAEQLDEWLMSVDPGPFWTSAGGPGGTVNTAYVDVVVDANTAMRAIDGIFQEAIALGAKFPAGTRAGTYLKDFKGYIERIDRVSNTMLEGVYSTHAQAIAEAQRMAAARGADIGDDETTLHVINAIKQLMQLGEERVVEPGIEAAEDLLEQAKRGAEQLAKSDIVKWALGVGGVALVAYFALKR